MALTPGLMQRRGLFGASARAAPNGQVAPGNLPEYITQRVKNPDGSTSTVRTMSFGNDQGEVLVPTVLDGRIASDDEAIQRYRDTGQSFGVFKTPEAATAYGQQLHNKHAAALSVGDGARGMLGASSRTSQQPAMTATEQPMKKGFDWGKLIGVLGDSLSIVGGGQAQYVPNLIEQRNRRQAQAYAEQTYQRRRGDEWTDWQRQEQWKRDNPAPVNNDTVNDYQFLASKLGPDAAKQYLQNLADGPPVAVDVANPDGSVTRQFIPRSQMQGGGMVAPQSPVGKLKPYGGQTATPSDNFR